MIETEELKPKPRASPARSSVIDFARWSSLIETKPHDELAEMILEESGYTDMWQKDRTADAAGRLENLKELVRSMEEFPDLGSLPRTYFAGHGCRRRRTPRSACRS